MVRYAALFCVGVVGVGYATADTLARSALVAQTALLLLFTGALSWRMARRSG